jgi:hypothetical protein
MLQAISASTRCGLIGPSSLRLWMTSAKPWTNDRLTRYGLIGHISLKKVFSTRACRCRSILLSRRDIVRSNNTLTEKKNVMESDQAVRRLRLLA